MQEVLERALGTDGLATLARHQQIGGQRHGLDADEQRQKVRGVDHRDHSCGGEQHQRVVLALFEVVFAHERRRNQQGRERGHDRTERRERATFDPATHIPAQIGCPRLSA